MHYLGIEQREKSSEELYKMEDFYRQTGAGQRKYTSEKWVGCGQITFL